MILEVFEIAKQKYGSIDIVAYNCAILNEFDWLKCFDVNFVSIPRLYMKN